METIINDLSRYIGQTVTIFTTSGGLSGSGFTGVLISIDANNIRIINQIGAAPACPLGSNFNRGGNGGFCNFGNGNNNFLGAVTVIPVNRIAGFTHNAI